MVTLWEILSVSPHGIKTSWSALTLQMTPCSTYGHAWEVRTLSPHTEATQVVQTRTIKGGEKGGELRWPHCQPYGPDFMVSSAKKGEEASCSGHLLWPGEAESWQALLQEQRWRLWLSQPRGLGKDTEHGLCHNCELLGGECSKQRMLPLNINAF